MSRGSHILAISAVCLAAAAAVLGRSIRVYSKRPRPLRQAEGTEHARVTSSPERTEDPRTRHPEEYPWTFGVDSVRLHTDSPTEVNEALRERLDAFKDRPTSGNWSWLVHSTRKISKHDFEVLTGGP